MSNTMIKRTSRLSGLILRRDRIRIPIWLIGICFFTFVVPLSFLELYGSQQDRDVMAETMENPAMIAMVGPADLTNYTIGVMTAHQMLLLTAVVVGLMSILLVSRHTRGDEEDGRIEMIRSLPVGRLSNLHATLMVYTFVNILLALIVGFGLYALNIESMDLEGSLLYGATLGATGIVFAGVTALFAQLSESSRGTIGLSIAVLLIAYLIRGIGDVSNEALSWVSPLGWVTKTEAYGANDWWPILLMLGVSICLFFLAYYLNAIRDLGAGFLPSKPGKKHASAFLQSPIGLSLRLQRTGTIAWAIGMFVIGASYGSVLGDLDSFFEGNEMMMQMLASEEGYSFTEQFLPMLMIVMAILAAIPPVMAMNKLYGEEKKNRIEHLLGRAVSRTKLMGSLLIIAVVNGFVMISLAAIGLWVAGVSVMEEPFEFGTVYGMAVAYYPAILVMISVAVLLIGVLPKLTSFTWLYLFYSFVVLYLGGIFQLDEWVGDLSPFGHVPQLPIEDMAWVPIGSLTIVAVMITVIGFVGYNKRDMEG
ncbi:ABC-2 type transport system permease protein [Oceanobacillus limi]|uniref:ABC-2 type transport system permease protein n=1 Tax=Oceanobacillus limi TaxID=930131 RepID=A0A1I0B7G3_9BACI|nr:ABC transporter permease [Oceanobacillus limi]SET02714.1 ABC-2 type transport system permease protein [Oceanobacillus limi]